MLLSDKQFLLRTKIIPDIKGLNTKRLACFGIMNYGMIFKGSHKNKHTHLTCLFVRILRCDNARILQYAPIVAP